VKENLGPLNDFAQYTDEPVPHFVRAREILKKHPEVGKLIGRNPHTLWCIIGVVALQISAAAFIGQQSWWIILLGAYLFGAFCNHGLFVLTHECTHNTLFKKRNHNLWAGILCDLPNGFPTAVGFRRYHIKHHAFLAEYDHDADLAYRWEARLIGNSALGKAVWLLFFPIVQLIRPPRIKNMAMVEKWTVINIIVILITDFLLVYFFGWGTLVYLIASLFFSVGLHPLGARWIQEHYLMIPNQETYNYSGWLNKIQFNIGYHNEHHDFPGIPWNRLPQVSKLAPEYYEDLYHHPSWTKLLFRWIFSKELTLFSRTIRKKKPKERRSPIKTRAAV